MIVAHEVLLSADSATVDDNVHVAAGCGGEHDDGSDAQEPDRLIIADDIHRVDRELTAGELACPTAGPSCARAVILAAAGCAPATAAGMSVRRGCCRGSVNPHVLVPGVMVPRRADAVEVVDEALAATPPAIGSRPPEAPS